MAMLTRTQVQLDILDLLADHFTIPRNLTDGSNAFYFYVPESEGKGTIKIRPSMVVTQSDCDEKIPILAVSYDKPLTIRLGMNDGEVSYDPETASSLRVSQSQIPIYINSIAGSENLSDELAQYTMDMLAVLKYSLLEKPGYQNVLFENIGVPTIIRNVGPGNIIFATPIAGYVIINRAFVTREKAKTLTQLSAYINGDNVWNGGPTDE